MIKTFEQLEPAEQAILKNIAQLEDFSEETIYRNGENYFRAVGNPRSKGNDFVALEPFITVKEVQELINNELPQDEDTGRDNDQRNESEIYREAKERDTNVPY